MPDKRLLAILDPLWPGRRYPSPERSPDRDVRGVLTALRTLPTPAPRPQFRADLRVQLVAVTERLVTETATAQPLTTRRGQWRNALGRLRLRRPLAVLASAAMVLALLLGGAVWISGSALPGDALYGIKRAKENVQLSVSGDARGSNYLAQAKTRVNEVLTLWTDGVSSTPPPVVASGVGDTAGLMSGAFDEADSDVRDGAKLLAEKAVRDRTADPLAKILDWAPGQIDLLTAIVGAIPPSPLHQRAVASQALAQRALGRATELKAALGCNCQTPAQTDDLGPLPCTTCASGSPSPSGTSSSSVPGGTSSGGTSSAPTSSGGSSSAASYSGAASGAAIGGQAAGVEGAASPTPSLSVSLTPSPSPSDSLSPSPSLDDAGRRAAPPPPLPFSLSLTLSPCVEVSLGPIGLGSCPTP